MLEIAVRDPSAAGEARRLAVAAARAGGFDDVLAGRVAIVATELATNVLKHGGGGRLLVGETPRAIDLIAIDRGPGIADVRASLADGYSTVGTAGNGLGAVRRLSQAFEVASWPNKGTAVYARLARPDAPCEPEGIAAIAVALAGEPVSGDAWACHADADGLTVFMVDGLGHGTDAAVAANEAVRQFQRTRGEAPLEIVRGVHAALRHTRGGAVAAARYERAPATVMFCGVGNIAGCVVGPGGALRRMVSHNGTAGHNARKTQAFEYPASPGPLILHTDGISTGWTLDAYPGLARAHPMLIAAVLYRDHARARDDGTIVVAQLPP